MPQYYEFEVSLRDVEPRMWRRFLVRSTATFAKLHETIQEACGWQNCHLYEFRDAAAGQTLAGLADDEGWGEDVPDARKVKLASRFRSEGDRCLYLYDFGDGWEHDVELVRVITLPETFTRRLLDGKRAFPPEDSGGIIGYWRCLAALGHTPIPGDVPDFDVGELQEVREWVGDWRPEAFDPQTARKVFDR